MPIKKCVFFRCKEFCASKLKTKKTSNVRKRSTIAPLAPTHTQVESSNASIKWALTPSELIIWCEFWGYSLSSKCLEIYFATCRHSHRRLNTRLYQSSRIIFSSSSSIRNIWVDTLTVAQYVWMLNCLWSAQKSYDTADKLCRPMTSEHSPTERGKTPLKMISGAVRETTKSPSSIVAMNQLFSGFSVLCILELVETTNRISKYNQKAKKQRWSIFLRLVRFTF